MIKIFAFDLDGTLTQHKTPIDDKNRAVLENLAKRYKLLMVGAGNTCYKSGPIVHNLWGAYLKTDIVQIAHHGMWPSVECIYHDIAGEVVLVPNLCRYFKNHITDSRWAAVIDVALSYAKDLYVSGDKLMVHRLPYVFENNKEEMYDYIINYSGRD